MLLWPSVKQLQRQQDEERSTNFYFPVNIPVGLVEGCDTHFVCWPHLCHLFHLDHFDHLDHLDQVGRVVAEAAGANAASWLSKAAKVREAIPDKKSQNYSQSGSISYCKVKTGKT